MHRIALTLIIVLGAALTGTAQADMLDVDIKFTAKGLGFTTDDGVVINDGGSVDPDVPGKLITSTTAGQGSILTIQTDGLAGPGTLDHPLFVTVTGRSHLDTLTGIPANSDYQAGAIMLSKEDKATPRWCEGRHGHQGVHSRPRHRPAVLRREGLGPD